MMEYFKNNNPKFLYQMLGRLEQDCDYYLGNGNRLDKHLWAGSPEAQIEAMKEIYNKLQEKPEWLTLEQIERLEIQMKDETISKIDKYNKKSTCQSLVESQPIQKNRNRHMGKER